jgi:predicted O-methyltransferase YrrM
VPSIELKTLATKWPWALRHPEWIAAYGRGGIVELYRTLVDQSVEAVRRAPRPATWEEALGTDPTSAIGQMGGTQEFLYHFTRWLAPDLVVETGVFRGISTAFLLAALHENGRGHLYSIDLPDQSLRTPEGSVATTALPRGVSTGFAIPGRLRERWTLIAGSSRSELVPLLTRLGGIDLFFHDSDHTYATMRWEYSVALGHLRARGVLASDDVGWNSAFADVLAECRPEWSRIVRGKLGFAQLRPGETPTDPVETGGMGSRGD